MVCVEAELVALAQYWARWKIVPALRTCPTHFSGQGQLLQKVYLAGRTLGGPGRIGFHLRAPLGRNLTFVRAGEGCQAASEYQPEIYQSETAICSSTL